MSVVKEKSKELPSHLIEEIAHQIKMIDELRAALAHTERERMAMQRFLASCLHQIKRTSHEIPPEMESVLQKASRDEAATAVMNASLEKDVGEWVSPLIKFRFYERAKRNAQGGLGSNPSDQPPGTGHQAR